MRRGLSVFRGYRRINRGLLLSRLYRARGLLYVLLALLLLAAAALLALLARLTLAVLG
jgi:hypothetical protein